MTPSLLLTFLLFAGLQTKPESPASSSEPKPTQEAEKGSPRREELPAAFVVAREHSAPFWALNGVLQEVAREARKLGRPTDLFIAYLDDPREPRPRLATVRIGFFEKKGEAVFKEPYYEREMKGGVAFVVEIAGDEVGQKEIQVALIEHAVQAGFEPLLPIYEIYTPTATGIYGRDGKVRMVLPVKSPQANEEAGRSPDGSKGETAKTGKASSPTSSPAGTATDSAAAVKQADSPPVGESGGSNAARDASSDDGGRTKKVKSPEKSADSKKSGENKGGESNASESSGLTAPTARSGEKLKPRERAAGGDRAVPASSSSESSQAAVEKEESASENAAETPNPPDAPSNPPSSAGEPPIPLSELLAQEDYRGIAERLLPEGPTYSRLARVWLNQAVLRLEKLGREGRHLAPDFAPHVVKLEKVLRGRAEKMSLDLGVEGQMKSAEAERAFREGGESKEIAAEVAAILENQDRLLGQLVLDTVKARDYEKEVGNLLSRIEKVVLKLIDR